jgi:hypothetical protein
MAACRRGFSNTGKGLMNNGSPPDMKTTQLHFLGLPLLPTKLLPRRPDILKTANIFCQILQHGPYLNWKGPA